MTLARTRPGLTALATLAALAASASCDGVPVRGLEDSFTLVVDKSTGDSESVKIDFLWVIDNSTSMCEEQVGLSDNFEGFINVIQEFGDFDARVAVTTMDVQCDPDNPEIRASQGEFNHDPATAFPPACHVKQVTECLSDDFCDAADLDCAIYGECDGGVGPWTCDPPQTQSCLETPNGSITSQCIRRCETDDDCRVLLGDARYFCNKPSSNKADWGCMLPPATKGLTCAQAGEATAACECGGPTCQSRQLSSCPFDLKLSSACAQGGYRQAEFSCCPAELTTDGTAPPCEAELHRDDDQCRTNAEWSAIAEARCGERGLQFVPEAEDVLPTYLGTDQLGLFSCLATMGVNQAKCFQYEQGLRAGLMALDADGPNAEQASEFLRDDAYLVLIFVSDEDDCSVADGQEIPSDFKDTCAFLETSDVGGPLRPVGHYINLFKSLKRDPARVIVAAIAGDAVVEGGTPEEQAAARQAQREAFVAAKSDKKACFHSSYICKSDAGIADWGSRYQQLTEGFGKNGIFQNVCNPEGIEPALEEIADAIVTVISKVCLPRPVLDTLSDRLTVRKWTTSCDVDGDCSDGFGCGETAAGTRRCVATLTRAADNTPTDALADFEYSKVPGGSDCTDALVFGDPPKSGQEVTISYQADPQLEL